LLKLHDAASTVGFLSLASAADAFHKSMSAKNDVNLAAMAESLSATLREAEQEWAAARPAHCHGAAASARPPSAAAPVAAPSDAADSPSAPQPQPLPVPAAMVRRYLESRH
jgi:hypothetical protein